METIRQPKTFQARVIETFSSQINYNYLYTLLYTNLEKMNYSLKLETLTSCVF